jgi:hypothetical protein
MSGLKNGGQQWKKSMEKEERTLGMVGVKREEGKP